MTAALDEESTVVQITHIIERILLISIFCSQIYRNSYQLRPFDLETTSFPPKKNFHAMFRTARKNKDLS